MKRFIAALLCLALCLPLLACPALAQEEVHASTTLSGSSPEQISNLETAVARINGLTVPGGAEFSFNSAVGPRTSAYGYLKAPNGRGVSVTGGGVAQAATTLYLALCLLGNDIEFTAKSSYGSKFTGSYVENGSDAILVDYNSGRDFAFVNHGSDLTIRFEMDENALTCALYVAEDDIGSFIIQPAGNSSGHTPVASASLWLNGTDALRNNIALAAGSINDTVLPEGGLFSFNDTVGPRVERFGYQSAVNGRGVDVIGGGVAQVASVIWMAIRDLDNIAIVEKSTYGSRYSQNYVSSSNDAILTDYNAGTDFSFRNIGPEPITINTYISGDMLICEIF